MMIRTLGLLFAALLCAGSVAAQELDVSKIYFGGTGGPIVFMGTGSPEGVHAAPPSSVYLRTDTGDWWRKATGTGTTGWVLMSLSGSGTAGTIPKWVTSTTLGNSIVIEDNGKIGIGVSPGGKLHVSNGSGTALYSIRTETDAAGRGIQINTNDYALGSAGTTFLLGMSSGTGNNAIAQIDVRDEGATAGGDLAVNASGGNMTIGGNVGDPDYVSQTIGWRIDGLGAADFRYLFTDELHAKVFIADLEQALAGRQIIVKSVALVGKQLTVPDTGSVTLWVRDLPSAPNMAMFADADYVALHRFDRSAGTLSIADAVGTVVYLADGTGDDEGLQSYTFTRAADPNDGSMAAPNNVLKPESIALDYGVSGNGGLEANAIDGTAGINAPYHQVFTWTTAPVAANKTLRTRLGNLRGITGTTGEYGLIAGTYDGTPDDTTRYFRASSEAFEIYGVNLLLYDGATNVIKLDRTAPSFALGSPVPSAYGTGVGVWMGKDTSYKFRVGDPAGGQLAWDGSTLRAAGWTIGATSLTDTAGVVGLSSAVTGGDDIRFWAGDATPSAAEFRVTEAGVLTASSGTIGGWTISADTIHSAGTQVQLKSGAAGSAYVLVSDGVANNAALVSGNLSSDIALFAGGLIANRATAPFRVTYAGALTATSATITGDITATSGNVINAIAAGAITSTHIAANTITAADIAAGTITATELAANSVTADEIDVSTLSAISADLGTVTAGSITGGTIDGATIYAGSGDEVTLDSSGITLTSGIYTANRMKWTDGSYIQSVDDSMYLGSSASLVVAADVVHFLTSQTATTGSPLVVDGSGYMAKFTGGADGAAGCSGVSDITLENGLVISVACSAPQPDVAVMRARIAQLEADVMSLRALLNELLPTSLTRGIER